jgi:endonuclease-3
MSAKKRADLITKLYKVVKKEYDVISPPSNRTVLEHMMYGCCLEDATFEGADEAFAKLQENFYDWNEVRVTTTTEIAEVVKCVNRPKEAAVRVKKALHGVFEKYYQFDLEFLRKDNLGRAVAEMSKFPGMSPYVVAYTAQNGLGGHSIPVDKSLMYLMYVIGAVSENELVDLKITGLERTIPKAKGTEFSILTHQLAVAFMGSPFSPAIRALISKIAPDAKERFPKRGGKKAATPDKKPATKKTAAKAAPAKKTKATKKAKPAKATKASKTATKKVTKKPAKAASKKSAKSSKKSKPKKSPNKKLAKKKPR